MKINVYNLYITDLYMVDGYANDYRTVNGKIIKKVVVYMDMFGNLFDFFTGRLYKKTTNMAGYDKVGTLYICIEDLIPLSDIMNFDDIKVSKRKVLQKLHSNPNFK